VGEVALIWDTISQYSPVLIAPFVNRTGGVTAQKFFSGRPVGKASVEAVVVCQNQWVQLRSFSGHVAIEYRWGEGHNDRLPSLIAELVQRQVSVIVTLESTPAALAAKGGDSHHPGHLHARRRPGADRPR
jgi:hypothetical protein